MRGGDSRVRHLDHCCVTWKECVTLFSFASPDHTTTTVVVEQDQTESVLCPLGTKQDSASCAQFSELKVLL